MSEEIEQTTLDVPNDWFGVVLFDGSGPVVMTWNMTQIDLDGYFAHGPARAALATALEAWAERLRQPPVSS